MQFLRRLGLGLAASVFSLLIFLFATFVSLYVVFDSPGPLKTALHQSGVYDVVLQNTVKKNQQQSGQGALPVEDTGAQEVIQEALPPAELQRIAEQVIDGTYSWVHGDTAKPSFVIDLASIKARIADNVAAYLEQKLTALPVCPAGTPLPQTADEMLKQNCRPANAPVTSLVAQARQQALSSGVLENSTIDASTFKNSSGKPIFDANKQVPVYHHYFVTSLFIMPMLIVLTAFAVVFASSTRRTGLRRLSVILLTTGIYSTAVALLGVWGIGHAANSLSHQTGDTAVIQEKAIKLIQILAHDLRTWWAGFGMAYILLGIAGLLIVWLLKKRQLHHVMSDEKKLGHNLDIPPAGTRFDPKQTSHKPPEPHQPHPPKKLQL